jgi:hypothetical protein
MVYDTGITGFTGPSSYDTNGGFIGATGPQSNSHIFIDPNHCYYSKLCLQDAAYTRFVTPNLIGLTGNAQFNAQQIINADQYRCFNYPMPNFVLANQLFPPVNQEIINGVPQVVAITNIEFLNGQPVPEIVEIEPRRPF